MADFTDTITLSFAMNGRAQSFSYSQTYTEPNNVVRYSSDFGVEADVQIPVENASVILVANKSRQKAVQLSVTDNADPMQGIYLEAGSIFDLHEGAAGGMYGKDTANITTFLDPELIDVLALSAGEVSVDILILNYAS